MLISLENMHKSELVKVHQDGFAAGYSLGQSDIGEVAMKRVTDKACMAFWFGNDPQRVGKAIQKVAIK